MPELEIKLQIPPPQLGTVRAAMRRGRCATTRLRALVFDTPGHHLAAAGCSLRVRREGRRWVQALKGPGDGLLSRFEHEVPLGSGRAVPAPDLARHAAAPGGEPLLAALNDALGGEAGTLAPLFEVNVVRTHRRVRHEGASIELALDEGWVQCGASRERVCELELELETGSVGALVGMARRWALRHGLWIDVRSKAQRGYQLLQGDASSPAMRGAPPVLSKSISPDAALRACVGAALQQILANAAELAAGRGDAEHVHQARIGLRRLLSVLREFGDWSADVQAQWSEDAASLFRSLGQARDRDALSAWIEPQLLAAGAPPSQSATPAPSSIPAALFRSAEATRLLLDLMAFVHGQPVPLDAASHRAGVSALAAPALARLHRRLRRAGKAFDALDEARRHHARKQAKRLRYCAESLSSLWPASAWQAYAQRLKNAQDALGRVQDASLAQAVYSAQPDAGPQAWFALGWLAAQRPGWVAEAGQALRKLGKRPKFLR
jgi:triphosphatase